MEGYIKIEGKLPAFQELIIYLKTRGAPPRRMSGSLFLFLPVLQALRIFLKSTRLLSYTYEKTHTQEGDGEPNFGYAVLERGGACNKQVVRNSGPDFRREVGARNEGLRKGTAWGGGGGESFREKDLEEEKERREGGSCCL